MLALSELDAEDLTSIAHGHLDDLVQALKGLSDIVPHLADRDSIAAIVYELHSYIVGWPTKGAPALARLVLDDYKASLMSEAGERTFETVQGRWEIKQSKNRTGWRHDELIPVVVKAGQRERRIIDPENGEVEDEGFAVARAIRECFSLGAGKIRGLTSRGIDPADYCNEEAGSYDVVIPAPSEAR